MQLRDLRKKVDGIDRRIVGLLNERTHLALKIGGLKIKAKGSIYVPERESSI